MSKPWFPRIVQGGRQPRRRIRRPAEWQPYRRRRFTAGELRLTVLAGVALGLAAAFWEEPEGFAVSRSGGPVRVIDGDTFHYAGEKIRIADIDTPEVQGRCPYETALAAEATRRLEALLAQGPFELHAVDRDEDRYGRKLRIVMRGGESVGGVLVAEGLARRWEGARRSWCA